MGTLILKKSFTSRHEIIQMTDLVTSTALARSGLWSAPLRSSTLLGSAYGYGGWPYSSGYWGGWGGYGGLYNGYYGGYGSGYYGSGWPSYTGYGTYGGWGGWGGYGRYGTGLYGGYGYP